MLRSLINLQGQLAECPLWCEVSSRLFWTDIPKAELLAVHPDSMSIQRWVMPEPVGSFAFTDDPDVLLLGLRSELAYFNLRTEKLTSIAPSPGVPGTRINDGRCDRDGNFVFSTMSEAEEPSPIGEFFRLNATTLETERLSLGSAAIPNSICFSPDGSTMYYCDSMQGQIMCCDYPSLENQRAFTSKNHAGAPDGSCVDAKGFLWNAEWGGGRVVRYDPRGNIDRIVSSNAAQMTCPVIGGDGLNKLYCTSASVGLDSPNELDGSVMVAREHINQGLAESVFMGNTQV